MAHKELKFNEDARRSLQRGVDIGELDESRFAALDASQRQQDQKWLVRCVDARTLRAPSSSRR